MKSTFNSNPPERKNDSKRAYPKFSRIIPRSSRIQRQLTCSGRHRNTEEIEIYSEIGEVKKEIAIFPPVSGG